MNKLRWIPVTAFVLLVGGWWSLRAVGHDETEWVRVERDDLVLGVEVVTIDSLGIEDLDHRIGPVLGAKGDENRLGIARVGQRPAAADIA